MKKVSTAAVRQTKNFSDRKLTIGFDLGIDGVVIAGWMKPENCFWKTGELLLEEKLGTTPRAMKEVLGGMPHSRIAREAGMHSPWVSRLLSELGHEVIVAHARKVRLIAALQTGPAASSRIVQIYRLRVDGSVVRLANRPSLERERSNQS